MSQQQDKIKVVYNFDALLSQPPVSASVSHSQVSVSIFNFKHPPYGDTRYQQGVWNDSILVNEPLDQIIEKVVEPSVLRDAFCANIRHIQTKYPDQYTMIDDDFGAAVIRGQREREKARAEDTTLSTTWESNTNKKYREYLNRETITFVNGEPQWYPKESSAHYFIRIIKEKLKPK